METVYARIARLIQRIKDETGVVKRRAHCAKLRELLNSQRNQEMLLQEAKSKEALSAVWTTILRVAVVAAEKGTTKKGTRYTKEDVAVPYYMLLRLDEFSKFAKTDSLLDTQQVRELLGYCVSLLSDENACEVAEAELLNMLEHMCSRPDYVAHFRAHNEMENILAELEQRLEKPDSAQFESSAKVFYSLLTTAKTLGIGMQRLLPRCLDMMDGWCKDSLRAIRASEVKWMDIAGLDHMFGAAAAILSCHPEHAIFDLSTKGTNFLRLAKKCYPNAATKRNKEALIEYFLAHLLVCQTAGKLQGLLPGDLGDVGKASLDNDQVVKLLEMIVTDHEISKVRMGNEVRSQVKGHRHSKKRLDTREPSMEPTDLSRRHFELCARLLACSQRQYLSDAEWDAIENPEEAYIEAIPRDPHPETTSMNLPISTSFKSCSQSDFVNSPWISRVGLPLWSFCDNLLSRDASQVETPAATQDTSFSAASLVFGPQNDIQHFSSVLQEMSEKMFDEAPKSPVPFLQLVCACAETFPMGQCWTSNTRHNWHAYTSEDVLSEDKAYCNGCSPDDIALVISLVTNILEAFGNPNGNVQTQRWALTCLIRLAESSALVAFASEQRGESSHVLHVVWRRVWDTLFRADLRYTSYTRNASSDTLGELVLVLLTEIVNRRCTDAPVTGDKGIPRAQHSIGEFVYANQMKVWCLDAFSNGASVRSQAVFDLINAVLRYAGLSEEGRDLIDGAAPMTRPANWDGIRTSSRRYRLVALCLRYLESTMHLPTPDAIWKSDYTEAAIACLTTLVTGKSTPCVSVFDRTASIRCGNRYDLNTYFCVTNIPVDRRDRRHHDSSATIFSTFFQSLWGDQIDFIPKSWLRDSDLSLIEFDESELTISRHLLDTCRQLLGDRHCDFVSLTTASALHTFVTDILIKMSSLPSESTNGDFYEFDDSTMTDAVSNLSVASMVYRIFVLKLIMTVAFSSPDDDVIKQSDMDLVEGHLNSCFDDFVEHFPCAEQYDDNCAVLVTSLLQVLRGLSAISLSIDGASIPETVSARLKSLFNVCKRMVDEYSHSRELAGSGGTSNRQNSAIGFDSDEELDRNDQAQPFQGESDDSEDDSPNGGRKRRRDSNRYGHERKRPRSNLSSNREVCKCPNSESVNHLASILVLLQPSYGICRFIADAMALPRTETGGAHRNQDAFCEVDVGASLHCLSLFCSPRVIHRDQSLDEVSAEDDLSDSDNETVRNGTIVSLCCELIRAIRTASGPGSQFRCFGFEICADLVYHREKEGGRSLDSFERRALIDLLLPVPAEKSDRKVLKGMPKIRARQVAAATSVFRDAQERLHHVFDPQFKNEIIAPCLAAMSALVRKKATVAVGAALQSFTQQVNIVNDVTKHLAPLLPTDDSSLSGQFRVWWESKNAPLKPESSEDHIWKRALFTLQSFAVETKGIIAASTTSKDIFCECLFDLVLLAAERPDLEALCYHACEKAANLAGFGTVQRLLMSESEYICGKWLDTGNLLENMPLLFTAPTVLFMLLQSGSAKFLFRDGAIELSKTRAEALGKDKRSKAFEDLRKLAAHEYVARSAYFLVPIICIRKARQSSEDEEIINGYLEEAAETIVSSSGVEGTKALLTVNFPHILAVVEPFLYCVDEEKQQDGRNVVSYLKKTLSDDFYKKSRHKKAKKALHQLLQNWGKSNKDFERRDVPEEVVSEAVVALAQDGGSKVEPFAAIGSSVTECILYSRFWLSESVLDRQKERRWSAFQLIFPLVLKYVTSAARFLPNSQLGFCIHTILDILADDSMSRIHSLALKSLNDLLATVLSLECASQYSSEISPVFYRLVGTLVIVHERYQDKLIEECLSSWKRQRRLEHSSSGLLLTARSSRSASGSAWGWEDEQEKRIISILDAEDSNVKKRIFDTLTGTYDALKSLFENVKSLRGSAAVPIESLSEFASKTEFYTSLLSRNEKYCARSLVGRFLAAESSEVETTEKRVSAFLNVSKALLASHLGSPSMRQDRDGSIPVPIRVARKDDDLNADFRLLVDELHHVQVSLEQSSTSPMEVNTRNDIDMKDRFSLVNLLLKLCEVSFPKEVRSAASRCLGALGPSDVEGLASAELELSENETELFLVAQEDGDVLSRIKGSCLEMLGRYLLSPRPETAIAALEASRAILTSKDASYNFAERGDCRRLLDPLIRKRKSSSKSMPSAFVAPEGYLECMLQKVTLGDVELTTKDDLSWCWHEALWMTGRNGALSFEDWVKFITCAMISCCFVGDEEAATRGRNESVRGSGMFFRYCIKLCALEHEFAAKAFPGIVLDLLFSGAESGHLTTAKGEQPQTLANQYLSRCFTTLIEPAIDCEHSEQERAPRIQALSLAVDTIDMLRFIMQKRFDQSRHKINFGVAEVSSSTSGQPERIRIQNGVVLHLNGLSVARACIQANRFASALFYADLHSEMCYGSAGRILERMANGEVVEDAKFVDISGFDNGAGSYRSSNEGEPRNSRVSSGKHLLPFILGQSFTALCDDDAAGAVKMESAAMSFLDDRFKWNTSDSLQVDTVERLKALDMQCQDQNGRIMAGQRVLDCMGDIGLDSAMQTYTGSLARQSGSPSGDLLSLEQDALRERWFCDRFVKSMEWDGEMFSGAFAQEPQTHVGISVPVGSRVGFHEGLCKALSSFIKDNNEGFRQTLSLARGSLIDELSSKRQGEAPLRSLVNTVEKLQFLNDIENLNDIESCKTVASMWQTQNEVALGIDVVVSPLTATNKPLRLNDLVMSFREVMIRSFQTRKTTSDDDLKGNLVSHLWHISAVARLVGRSDLADSSVRRLHTALHQKHPTGLDIAKLLRVRFEEAMIMESRGEFSSAIRGMDLLSSRLKGLKLNDDSLPPPCESLYVDALLTCGEWMSRYKVQPGRVIMDEYLTPAAKSADTIRAKNNNDHAAVYRSFAAHLALAKLSSSLFDSVCKIVDSPEWDKAAANITLKDNEIQNLEKMATVDGKEGKGKKRKSSSDKSKRAQKKPRDVEVLLPGKKIELANMRKDFETTKESIPTYLKLALESYCQALIHAPDGESSDVSTHVYRFVSLWFENCDKSVERAKVVNEVMDRMIDDLPSFRFIPLAYQIFSRLGSGPEEFQKTLSKLVHTMCVEHPYHCIVQLLALSNGQEVGTARGSKEYRRNLDIVKINCAKDILEGVQKSDSVFASGLVESYSALVQAYIDLALASVEDHKKGSREVPNIPLSAMKNGKTDVSKALASIRRSSYLPCVISKPPDISPGGHYGDGIDDPKGSELIDRFDSTLSISGKGRSVPKFIVCHGRQGGAYKQVVKGNDDVRADAVMQQVFSFVNDLMKRRNTDSSKAVDSVEGLRPAGSARALKDQLRIVTYHIVPLSPATGVMEFVKDSIPFGVYCIGTSPKNVGAHSKYYPGEWGCEDSKDLMKNAEVEKKREVYDTICRNFSPAFRHFFTERFGHSLPLWYAAKMKYTRSCAVNSIVGHMLGIGDRHVYNILIKENTGECVHIDFGIVFEQGKLLLTPETVPFRLTRDIVDGMGPCGTEGTFTRAAEETAILLRQNTSALLTILSAVVSDPLYKWNVTPREARNRQNIERDEGEEATEVENEVDVNGAEDALPTADQKNEAAVRAIARIQEKLQGYEDGTSGERQSVEGQVQLLINEARDEENLSKIFHGWSPFV